MFTDRKVPHQQDRILVEHMKISQLLVLNCAMEKMLQAENNLLVHVLEMLLHEGVSIMSLCFYGLGLKKKRKKYCLHFNTYYIQMTDAEL